MATVIRTTEEQLLLGEWACLGILYPAPTHGFAIAARLKPGGDVGRVWSLSRPLTYRSLDQLTSRGYVHAVGEEPGIAGGNRTILAATRSGRAQLRKWLGHARRPPPRPAQRTAPQVDHRRAVRHRRHPHARRAVRAHRSAGHSPRRSDRRRHLGRCRRPVASRAVPGRTPLPRSASEPQRADVVGSALRRRARRGSNRGSLRLEVLLASSS